MTQFIRSTKLTGSVHVRVGVNQLDGDFLNFYPFHQCLPSRAMLMVYRGSRR